MEQELRKQAIQRYRNNEKPKSIYTDLNRSKFWFFKWLKCYQSGDPDWYKDKSRAPNFSEPLDFNNIHQADLIGPRYIKADGRFYSFNVMDVFSHRAYIESQRTKEDRQVAASLMRCCKTLGIPDFLQISDHIVP